MPQVLRLDDAGARIQYAKLEAWRIVVNSGREWNRDGTYHRAKAAGAQLFFLFRGTGISLYGLTGRGGALAQLQLDGKDIDVHLIEGNSSDTTAQLLSFQGLEDEDHQLFVFMWTLEGQTTVNVSVDYFEIASDNNKGFDLSWAGPNAANIPKEAILVGGSDQDIQLFNSSQWTNTNDLRFYRVAIWFYGSVDRSHGFYTISLDDSKPDRLTSNNPTGLLTQQMLWSKVSLTPGRHTLTLRQDDDDGKNLNVDFFRVLRNEDASVLTLSSFTAFDESTTLSNNPPTSTTPASSNNPPASTTPASSSSSSPSSPSNSSPIFLVVGLSVWFILGATILFAFLYKRKKHLPTPTPYFIVPSTVPSTWPVARKQRLPTPNQPRRDQPEASGLSNSTPNIPSSPGPTNIGPPPSYQSHYERSRM